MRRKYLDIAIILLLGLIPILWFKSNQIIAGHDAGLPLSPAAHFLDRLFAWTHRFAFGIDASSFLPGFFIHGLEYLISLTNFSLHWQQVIMFIVWFVLPGLTMYYLGTRISQKMGLHHFALPAAIFYMINHFLLQGWFIAERTKFSLYAALPLLIALLMDWADNVRSTFKTAVLISLIFLLLNGGGSLPLFGGIILATGLFIVFYIVTHRTIPSAIRLVTLFFLTGLFSLILQAYWLMPFILYVKNSYTSAVTNAGGLTGTLGWIQYQSQDSSLINLLRLQGIPEWYQNANHPYASVFLYNPFFIILSFMLPILALLPITLYKERSQKKYVFFFLFLAIISVVFIAGSHKPFGPLYILMVRFIPGFIAFRSPFYKFAMALWFSYAILIGLTVNYALEKLRKKNHIYPIAGLIIFIALVLIYNFSFLTGSFFDYIKGQRSMRIAAPQYIFDYAKWSEKNATTSRTLALPISNSFVDTYKWGYWSLAPLTSLLTRSSVINAEPNLTDDEKSAVETLHRMMVNNNSDWPQVARLLGIKYFLLRKDFKYDEINTPTYSPAEYNSAMHNESVSLVKKFGEWEVYTLKDAPELSPVSLSSNVSYVQGPVSSLENVVSLPQEQESGPYVFSPTADTFPDFAGILRNIIIFPTCISCDLQHTPLNPKDYAPTLTRGSILYKYINKKLPQYDVNAQNGPELSAAADDTFRSFLTFKKTIDDKEDIEIIRNSYDDYSNLLTGLVNSNKLLKKTYTPVSNDTTLHIRDILILEQEALIDVGGTTQDPILLEEYNKSYTLLAKLIQDMVDSSWESPDELHKRFIFSTPDNGEYSLLFKPNPGEQDNIARMEIDGESKPLQKIQSGKWMQLGTNLQLNKGMHKLELLENVPNLLVGSGSAILETGAGIKCFMSDAVHGVKKDTFKISFEFQRIRGGSNFFFSVVDQNTKEVPPFSLANLTLQPRSAWDRNTSFHTTATTDEFFRIAICNQPTAQQITSPTTLEIKNMLIKKVDQPTVALVKSVGTSTPVYPLKIDTINQVAVSGGRITTTKPSVVIQNQRFNSDWLLPSSNYHFTVNGYANGWIILPEQNQKIQIMYKIQKLVIYGFIVSGAGIIVAIIYLLFSGISYAQKHKKKN